MEDIKNHQFLFLSKQGNFHQFARFSYFCIYVQLKLKIIFQLDKEKGAKHIFHRSHFPENSKI